MAQTSGILDHTHLRKDHGCACGKDKYHRQSSSRRSPQRFAGVSNPPLESDSSDHQESDIQTDHEGSHSSYETQLKDAQRQITQLQAEKNDALRKLKEVTKMNSRWQKYDKEREVVVVKLTTQAGQAEDKIRELSAKIERLEAKLVDQRNRCEELELRWTDARVRAAERKSEVERIQREKEAIKLTLKQSEKKRQDLVKRLEAAQKLTREDKESEGKGKKDSDKDRDLYHMSKRVVDLKEKVDYLEKKVASHKTEMDQQADLYTQQISICLDDFKHEKKDREKCQKENAELKQQLKKAEDFASSLKVQITRYQDQQRTRNPKSVKPAIHHVQKYYANIYDENLDSWDDAGYALPSDVVRDDVPIGFDDTDRGVTTPVGHLPHAAAVVDPPPKYDDRSILGHVITSPPKTYQMGAIATAPTKRVEELVLH